MDVVVKTNNTTGYKLIMSTSDSNTYLTRDTSHDVTPINAKLDTLVPTTPASTGYSEADFRNCLDTNVNCMNKWGYMVTASDTDPSLVTSNYFPFTNNTVLATNHLATSGDTTTMRFAAKINYNQMAGSYNNTLVFTAVATYAAYHIDYYDGVNNTTTIATQDNAYNTQAIIPINPVYSGGYTAPHRTGLSANTYTFISWCDVIPGGETTDGYFAATTCPTGHDHAPGSTITIDPTEYSTNLKLYAYWDPTTFEEAYLAAGKSQTSSKYVMQDMESSICNAVTAGEKIQLLDTRSGSYAYWVGKLKDDKCWMLQNLRLGTDVSSLTITPTNSNVSSNFTLTKDSDGKMPQSTITDDVAGNTAYIYDGSAYYCSPVSGNSYVGCYYNWYTATAGIGTSSITGKNTGGVGTDVNSSICPKGWHLPKGGSQGDFQALSNQYPSADAMLVAGKTAVDNASGASLPGFLLSGHYNSGGASNVGTNGNYWSRTAYSTGFGYTLRLNSTAVVPQNYISKYYGFSVRCVAYGS